MIRKHKKAVRRRHFRRIPRFKGQTINRMVPNFITICSLAAGLTAVRFAIMSEWMHAVTAILIAAVLDALDGRMARLLKAASKFGAELDSLSDVIAFGVAPAFVVYLWALQDIGDYGWVAGLFFTVCCALRLARFNITELPPYAYNYFIGMPAPAGACMCILPMVLTFQFGDNFVGEQWIVGVWIVTVGIGMVSHLPTYSFKSFKVPHGFVLPVLACGGLVVAALVINPWLTLSVVASIYITTIPFAFFTRRRLEAEAAHIQEGDSPPDLDDAKTKQNSEPTT